MLRCPHHPPDLTPTLPPISALITPYASTPLPLTILTLPWSPQDIHPMPPSTLFMPHPLRRLPCLPLRSALPTCLQRRPSVSL
ncbi:hypothetical protein O181_078074 [Austropuccinia psidii MF-1]|uniref:Uncharacterized protein n=1 Tax=Austropuccinia psidii MF-1 TaxID=1389203 RepID=A0A9Q3IGY2_9BASI|nr:hypothetical protein [Austropuccinia psidii MF-1]